MKIKTPQTLANITTLDDLVKYSSQTSNDIVSVINGNIGFTDNCKTALVTVTFKGAETQAVDHSLGLTPAGYLISGRSTNIQVFDGAGDTTGSKISLQSTGAGVVKVLLFA